MAFPGSASRLFAVGSACHEDAVETQNGTDRDANYRNKGCQEAGCHDLEYGKKGEDPPHKEESPPYPHHGSQTHCAFSVATALALSSYNQQAVL